MEEKNKEIVLKAIDKNFKKGFLRNIFFIVFAVAFFSIIVYGFILDNNYSVIKNTGNDVKVIDPSSLKGSNINVVEDADLASINALPNEIVEKRTYTSRTFKNKDGSYTAEIYRGSIFFFDGKYFIDLANISSPVIEKKDVILDKIPDSNLIDFGTYALHKGVTPVMRDNNIIFIDYNNRPLLFLPPPYSTDADGKKSNDRYKTYFDGTNLSIFVEVDSQWLKSARYPVVVDPSVSLGGGSSYSNFGSYSGFIMIDRNPLSNGRNVHNWSLTTGGSTDAYLFSWHNYTFRSFMEFNTSIIQDNAIISNVGLNLTVGSYLNTIYNINITRLNNTQISNLTKFPNNSSGNAALWDALNGSIGGFYKNNLTSFSSLGSKFIDLGISASTDLQNQLNNDYFSIGLKINNETHPFQYNIIYIPIFNLGFNSNDSNGSLLGINGTGESNLYPKLIVTYTTSACTSSCTYSGSGDWCINQTCQISLTVPIVSGDLYIYDSGVLNLVSGGINFTGANRNIYVYRGGRINIGKFGTNPGGFNK
jgi:hypothetical protein